MAIANLPVLGELLVTRLLATDITRDEESSSSIYLDQHGEGWIHGWFLPAYSVLAKHARDDGYNNAGALLISSPSGCCYLATVAESGSDQVMQASNLLSNVVNQSRGAVLAEPFPWTVTQGVIPVLVIINSQL